MDKIDGMLEDDLISLNPGDCMLLYTDGLTEATDNDGKMYSDEKLMEVFQSIGHLEADEIKKSLVDSVEDFEKNDDVTFLVNKRD